MAGAVRPGHQAGRRRDLNRYALHFDGATSYAQSAYNAAPVMQNLPLTLEAWVQPELRGDGTDFPTNVLSNDQYSGGRGFGVNVWSAGSQLKVEYSGGFRVVPGVNFTAGQWYHVAVVYTSGDVKTYVNGALADDFTFTQGTQNGSPLLQIGKFNDDGNTWGTRRFFKGTVAEARVWSAARSASDIQANYNKHLVGNETGLAAYYRFDEGKGNVARDLTANHVDVTLNGSALPTWVPSTVPIGITVKIELVEGSSQNVVLTIAANAPNDGTYAWAVPQALTPAGDYRVRVTRNDAGMLAGVSASAFTITSPISIYYVNDGTARQAGDWTTAPGNDANDGLTPATPKASIGAILAAYNLNPGDDIKVDRGVYNLGSNLILTAADSGIKIEGFHDAVYPNSFALVNRGNAGAGGSYAVELRGAANVTLDYLRITGGYYGVFAAAGSGSTGLTVSHSVIYGNNQAGVYLDTSNNQATVTGNTLYGLLSSPSTQNYGIYDRADGLRATNNLVYDDNTGIYVTGANATISNNEVYGSTKGISFNTYTGQSTISGNVVHDNGTGISATGAAAVSGNTVYNQAGNYQTGISLYYSEADNNVVHDNYYGIAGSFATVAGNRVYANTYGVSVSYSSAVRGNQVYGNAVGIVLGGYAAGPTSNNVVYGNASQGILVQANPYGAPQILNNTIYQPVGDAVRVEGNSANVQLRNNILWAQSGADISMADDSQVGFQSDYNDLYTTGTGKIGLWQGVALTTRSSWYFEVGQDGHSTSADPRLVNPAGADGILGYSRTAVGNAAIVNDGNAGFSLSSGWTQRAGSGFYGVYHTAPDGDGSKTASWSFAGLSAGATYQVAVTWPQNYAWAYDAPFVVFDGAREIGVVRVNEQQNPTGFTDGGAVWQVIGYYQVTGTSLTVQLSNKASNAGLAVAASGVRLQQVAGDHGGDDDFHLQASSPAVGRGDPASYYFREPAPDGDRIDQGAYGNTAQAAVSPAQLVQVLSPNGLEKLQAGLGATITWRSAGLTLNRPVALVDAGSSAGVDNWGPDLFNPGGNTGSFANAVDTSHVTDPAPPAVYQSYAYANGGVGNGLGYSLAIPDGSYTVRLHFAEPNQYIGQNQRKFDIKLQGGTVLAGYDIWADAGGPFIAAVKSFPVTVSGGAGLLVQLANTASSYGAVLSGLEVLAANPNGVANPAVNLEYSADNGATWQPIASGVAMDRYGRGSYAWAVPAGAALGSQYLVRATATAGAQPRGVSAENFLVTNAGHSYYVNDLSTVGKSYTTAPGNNLNSGKSPDQPMANLAALLAAYTLHGGDTVYVDSGTYNLLRNVIFTAQDSAVTVVGPPTGTALLNRGNANNGSYGIELQNAPYVTISGLQVTGAYAGLYARNGSNSTDLTLLNSTIFGNNQYGVYLDASNDRATLAGDTVYGIPGNPTTRNQYYGIYVTNANDTVLNADTVYDHAGTGIYVSAARATVSANNVYGNSTGINLNGYGGGGDRVVVTGNTVHDNTLWGVYANNNALVSGNTVYGQVATNAAGINANNGVEVAGNVVYTNYNGIVSSYSSDHNNRLYNNTYAGILASNDNPVVANQVYSNAVGVLLSGYYRNTVADNLIFANTNQSILAQTGNNYYSPEIIDNTIYQPVGDAIRLVGGSQNVQLRNNIVWVLAGYDVYVSSDSQAGFVSNYNDLYKGTDPNAHIGFWNGAIQDTFANWQTATGKDANSFSDDPKFVNPAGNLNVLGYQRVNGVYVDGGPSDNFYLAKNSPAIDRGDSWAALATDIEGQPRRDDPGTANAGSPDYSPAVQTGSLFTATGTARNWQGTNTYFNYTLPFSFPFYDGTYTSVQVWTSGYLQFNYNGSSGNGLPTNRRISPLGGNLTTYNPSQGDDIFVDTSVNGQVTIRWKATNLADNSPANFAVVLFSDGRVRFDYGGGNQNVNPTVGISYGNNRAYQLVAGYNGSGNLANANSVLFSLAPGIVDLGAYEFRGSSLTVTPPRVTGTVPAAIDAGGTSGPISQILVNFSEEVNPIDARAAAVYELRKAGSHGFGSSDDVVYALTLSYPIGTTVATLDINGLGAGGLPAGMYRLTIYSGTTTTIHDLAGLRLDGTGSGTEGGDYVRVFTVVGASADLGVSLAVDNANPIEGGTVRYTLTVSNAGPAAATAVRVTDLLPAGLLFAGASTATGTYDGTTGIWNVGGLAVNGSATLVLTATLKGGTSGKTIADTAAISHADQTDPNQANNSASVSVMVHPAVATAFSVAGFPSPIGAGTAGTATVKAVDAYGNVIPNYVGAVHFTSSDPGAALPADYTFTAADRGVHTFTVTLNTVGTQAITATDKVNAAITGSQTGIVVTGTAVARFTVAGFPSPVTAGAAGTFTVTARDANGNVVTTYTGTVTFTSSDGQAMLPADYTFTLSDAGVHTFSATLKTAGTQAITATDRATSGVTGSQTGIIVTPAATSALLVAGFPSSVTAGVAGTVTVTAQDAYGNTTPGYTGTVHFTSSDPQAMLPGDYTFTAGDNGTHAFSATLFTAGTQAITAADTGTSTIQGTQGGIAVSAAAASTVRVTGFPSPTQAGVAGTVTVTLFDLYGNVATGYLGTVHVTSSDPQAQLPADYAFTAGDAGVHTFGVTLLTAGTQALTATDTANGSLAGSQTGLKVAPAGASVFLVAGFPNPVTAGVAGTFTVTVEDAYGNVIPRYTGTVHFTSSDGQAVLPADYTFTAADRGVHAFSATLLTAGTQALTATDTAHGSLTGSQTGIVVTPAPADHFVLLALSEVAAGTPFDLTVIATDPYGNTDVNYVGTVTFTSSDAGATLPADYTFTAADQGMHTFPGMVTLVTPGSQTVTGTDTVTGITGTATVLVDPGAEVRGPRTGLLPVGVVAEPRPPSGSAVPAATGSASAALRVDGEGEVHSPASVANNGGVVPVQAVDAVFSMLGEPFADPLDNTDLAHHRVNPTAR